MGRRVGIVEAAEIVGISVHELRIGIRSGRYPAMRVGFGKGKYLIDIQLLEARLEELMQGNIEAGGAKDYGKLRRVI